MNKNLIENVYQLLAEKAELFYEYEKISVCMEEYDFNDINQFIESREDISGKIDELEVKINKLSCSYELLHNAIRNSCNRNDLPIEIHGIFDKSQEIFSIVNRINKINNDVMQKISIEQYKLLEQIKTINTGQAAKASKFSNYSTDGSEPYIPNKIKSI